MSIQRVDDNEVMYFCNSFRTLMVGHSNNSNSAYVCAALRDYRLRAFMFNMANGKTFRLGHFQMYNGRQTVVNGTGTSTFILLNPVRFFISLNDDF